MKATYTYIAVIVMALIAVYFSLEQSRKFKELREVRAKYESDNEFYSAKAEEKRQELKKVKEQLAEAQKSRAELVASLDALRDTGDAYLRDVKKQDAFLAQVAEQKSAIEEARKNLNSMIGQLDDDLSIDNLDQALSEVTDQKENRVAKLDEMDVLIASAEKSLANNKEERERLIVREEERVEKMERNSMEAVITGVNQDWGFLVIGAGSNTGFTPQSGLIVQRDGRMIARVRPSAIEATQTIAEINFKSLAPGVRIQPGDRVIFETPTAN